MYVQFLRYTFYTFVSICRMKFNSRVEYRVEYRPSIKEHNNFYINLTQMEVYINLTTPHRILHINDSDFLELQKITFRSKFNNTR